MSEGNGHSSNEAAARPELHFHGPGHPSQDFDVALGMLS